MKCLFEWIYYSTNPPGPQSLKVEKITGNIAGFARFRLRPSNHHIPPHDAMCRNKRVVSGRGGDSDEPFPLPPGDRHEIAGRRSCSADERTKYLRIADHVSLNNPPVGVSGGLVEPSGEGAGSRRQLVSLFEDAPNLPFERVEFKRVEILGIDGITNGIQVLH